MIEQDTIFVWRLLQVDFNSSNKTYKEKEVDDSYFSLFKNVDESAMPIPELGRCKFCNSDLKFSYNNLVGGKIIECGVCGWGKIKWNYDINDCQNNFLISKSSPFYDLEEYALYADYAEYEYSVEDSLLLDLERIIEDEKDSANVQGNQLLERILRSFPVNSSRVSFNELGKYLQSNPNKFFNVSSRRIELLVGDIYRNSGYRVEITKSTRDGGKDLILLSNTGEQTIVEVKRHKKSIGVGIVRNLRGVQLTYGHTSAVLVATTNYTKAALNEFNKPNAKNEGYDLKLVDMQDLLKMLDVYKSTQTLVSQIKKLNL